MPKMMSPITLQSFLASVSSKPSAHPRPHRPNDTRPQGIPDFADGRVVRVARGWGTCPRLSARSNTAAGFGERAVYPASPQASLQPSASRRVPSRHRRQGRSSIPPGRGLEPLAGSRRLPGVSGLPSWPRGGGGGSCQPQISQPHRMPAKRPPTAPDPMRRPTNISKSPLAHITAPQ